MFQIYQVIPGETLFDIAKKVGSTVAELERINGIKNGTNIDGSYIIIPNKDSVTFESYKVKKGDSVYSIAKKYNVDYQTLLLLNGLNNNEFIYPDQEILIPRGNEKIYVTKEGDTIQSISKKLDKKEQDIISKNSTIKILPDQIIKY